MRYRIPGKAPLFPEEGSEFEPRLPLQLPSEVKMTSEGFFLAYFHFVVCFLNFLWSESSVSLERNSALTPELTLYEVSFFF